MRRKQRLLLNVEEIEPFFLKSYKRKSNDSYSYLYKGFICIFRNYGKGFRIPIEEGEVFVQEWRNFYEQKRAREREREVA